MRYSFYIYLLVMAGVTYLVRMLPLLLVRKKIQSRWLLSFLHYIPYAVLSAMTIPGCFYSTGGLVSAIVGTAVALVLAYREKSLLTVALAACAAVLVTDAAIVYLIPML